MNPEPTTTDIDKLAEAEETAGVVDQQTAFSASENDGEEAESEAHPT